MSKRTLVTLSLMMCLAWGFPTVSTAEESDVVKGGKTEEVTEGKKIKGDLALAVIALAAALVVGLCAIATGIAQSKIGAAGCGTLAERPESAMTVIIMLTIPETMVILGFVVGVVMLFVL